MVGDRQCTQADPCRGDDHFTRRANSVGVCRMDVQVRTIATSASGGSSREYRRAGFTRVSFHPALAPEAMIAALASRWNHFQSWWRRCLPGSGIAARDRGFH